MDKEMKSMLETAAIRPDDTDHTCVLQLAFNRPGSPSYADSLRLDAHAGAEKVIDDLRKLADRLEAALTPKAKQIGDVHVFIENVPTCYKIKKEGNEKEPL